MLRIFAVGFPFMGVFLMVEDVHAAVGMNTPGMVFNVIHAWLLQLVPVIVLTQWLGYGSTAIWWSISLSSVVSAVGFYLYYRRGQWLHSTV